MYDFSQVLPHVKQRHKIQTKIKAPHIFLIAQKEQWTKLLDLELKQQGYNVQVFHDGLSAAIAIRQKEPNLIILDCNTASLNNFNIYYCLRSTSSYIPIIALTNAQSSRERVDILDSGADYCLSKPLNVEEFLAIVQARLRQSNKEKSPILFFEDLELNSLSRQVYRNNQLIVLTTKEFNLLEYMMLHPLQVLTRVQILDNIWGYDFTGDSNIIEVYIRYLRVKLEQNNKQRLIYTVRSVGYVLRTE